MSYSVGPGCAIGVCGERFAHGPIGARAGWRYLLQPSVLHSLLIGEVEGAEPDLIPDACDDVAAYVDYTSVLAFHVQGESP